MKRIRPEKWQPVDNMHLEQNALDIAVGTQNNLVVAGPGAGKTELLAQKACYLLQTNTCPFPYKILAISFKRDAAYNLKLRVRQRCGEELSRRFDSLTFDSFAKQILDRFKQALPNDYSINNEYDLIFKDQTIIDFYKSVDVTYANTTNNNEILTKHSSKLPITNSSIQNVHQIVWAKMLFSNPPQLSFKMIMRLAELILNTNPKIKHYLQQTYRFVFLDEFQDTTGIQYDFLKTCFLGSNSYYTAVGDDKQRIMLWAGAKNTVFEDFLSDTSAIRIPLTMNFRCAPRLVALLNHLTQNLLGKSDLATPSPKWQPDQGECSVWVFENPQVEMQVLFKVVADWITIDIINPRDICILVKQQLSKYAGDLIDYFNQNGIKARDENKFQDMLTQDICSFIINALYSIFDQKNKLARQATFDFLSNLHTELEDYQLLRLEQNLSIFIKNIKKDFSGSTITESGIKAIINKIIVLADKDRIKATFPQYNTTAILDAYILEVEAELTKNYSHLNDIIAALDMLVGKDTIPVMTIHKSKGLEYHTVIFIGLEDGAFWSFQKQPDEDKCTFFVALSRAKERVIFTFSKERQGRYGIEVQTISKIRVLFDELQNSDIVSFEEKNL